MKNIPLECVNDQGETVNDVKYVLHHWKCEFEKLFSHTIHNNNDDNVNNNDENDVATQHVTCTFDELTGLNIDISRDEVELVVRKAKNKSSKCG